MAVITNIIELEDYNRDNNTNEAKLPDAMVKQRTSDYVYCNSLSPVENEFRLRKTYVPNRIISRHLKHLVEEEEKRFPEKTKYYWKLLQYMRLFHKEKNIEENVKIIPDKRWPIRFTPFPK